MSIKLILNSYYRSGSTYFFDAVRNNNPDLKCYYEPLNPGLSKMIDSKMNKFGLHKGYGYSDILEHYYLLSSDITSKIYRNLPMMSQGSFLDINIKNYMDIFDQMVKKYCVN